MGCKDPDFSSDCYSLTEEWPRVNKVIFKYNVIFFIGQQDEKKAALNVHEQTYGYRAVFTWLSKEIGFGFGFGFTTPFGWLVYLLWIWFYDSQVKTALLYHPFSSARLSFPWLLGRLKQCHFDV